MNDRVLGAQVTIRAMKRMVNALEDVGQQLPQNPTLFSLLAEGPLDLLFRRRDELSDHMADLKQVPAVFASIEIEQ
jgi:hypothetical protein